MSKTTGPCPVGDCPHEGKLINGYCPSCYHWMRTNPGKDPVGRTRRTPRPTDGACTVLEDGTKCTEAHYGHGMCQKHYLRTRIHGSPHIVLQRSSEEIAAFLLAAATATTDECIIAPGRSRQAARLDGKQMQAARAVWVLAHGDPGDLHVLHTCNGGSGAHGCINVRHLYLDTHQRNMRDKQEAERQARGETHGEHKLTEADVHEIRRRYRPGRGRQAGKTKELVEEFGVSPATISQVANRKTWRWLENDPS
ncbi:hypothetical protein [Streptomyces sp. NPDC086776]|uniref:hypothetical protein n=1 Tax=Streptomyces sp. NPDC086776 TaxID=3365756 RepID=UPI00381E3D3C